MLTAEYGLIRNHYGEGVAARTGVPLMRHIDDGLEILRGIGASDRACRAWCLHPLFQGDADLARTMLTDLSALKPEVVLLAMEYRSVANAYLSRREIQSLAEIRLSPLAEVNQMLVADKIQNYKDFARFHRATHPRAEALERYFQNWFERLEITLADRQRWWQHFGVAADLG